MSYHNDPYRVDYLKIYPCLKERPDVLEVLKKSDRKMKYMEVDLKSEQRRKNAENGAESYVPSKEDSLERLIYSAKCQFADDAEGVEDAVIRKDNLRRLRAALDQLSEEERFLIYALFFDERSERELEEMMGVHRMTIHNRKIRSTHEPVVTEPRPEALEQKNDAVQGDDLSDVSAKESDFYFVFFRLGHILPR